jgi:hypothetical protein
MGVYILSRLVLFPGLLSPDLGLTWCTESKQPLEDGEVTRPWNLAPPEITLQPHLHFVDLSIPTVLCHFVFSGSH